MIKKSIKILLSILLLVFLIIFYLSSVGVKTEKFNERIVNKILQINKKINVNLGEVKFLLDPYNFTVNIATKDPIVQLGDNKLEIKELKTNISLKSLFSKKFAVDDLQISTKFIKIDNLILLVRSFKSSTELLLLNNFTKGGSLIADIKLEFDEEGNIKKDYQITGFIKNIKLNFLNKIKVNNLNFEFDIKKNKYSLEKIKGIVNEIKFSSILIEINQKKDNFFIRGKMLTDKKKLIRDKIDSILGSFLKNPNIEKIKFSSESDFSFNVNKKLKINDVRIDSRINLDQLLLKNNLINLKSYLPNMDDVINFENQRVTVNYNKDKINIKGNGEILVKGKPDNISYEVIRDKEKLTFNTKINIKNNKLIIGFLDYEKKENLEASINIKGNLKKNKKINFDLISLIEKDNKISFKDINLSKDFKLISLHNFKFDYLNNKLIKNELVLKKNNSNYSIEGESFDATTLINKIMNSEDKNSSIFDSFNSEISLKINKTYIDELNFINNLSGRLNFKDNKIDNLDLSSFFPNNKKINFLIKTNDKQEKITKLFTDYPKPLIKRYDFIKGFEEGFLVYQSVKKNGVSNSLLTIENFKIKETPIFAKLLSLASLQGISDLLTGEGIRFDNFEMKFSNKKKLTTIEEMYAIGPAVSILMEGYIESKKKN